MTATSAGKGASRAKGREARLFGDRELEFVRAVSALAHGNPFLPERIENERRALGGAFVPVDPVWSMRPHIGHDHPNTRELAGRVERLLQRSRARLASGASASPAEEQLYEDLALFHLYHCNLGDFVTSASSDVPRAPDAARYRSFVGQLEALLALPGRRFWALDEPAHVYACFFQIYRAFYHIFFHIVGGSMPAARLRAAAWQSIFTHDMRRYRRSVYRHLGDVTTLIVGASGTGKELVARAIGLSCYLPLAPRREKRLDSEGSFHALNVSALSPTLVESELFGHRRGAFTGALEDRSGWLEACPPAGAVFLDEVGDIEPTIQVKLLRVLQDRTFQRLGETTPRVFAGKLIAATNRDLAQEVASGRFRQDFYYRLCADVIQAPTLAEQLADSPGELGKLVHFLARRVADGPEADRLTDEVVAWIGSHLGPRYAWPGNVRELEQCVRNVMIRHEYRPLASRPAADARAQALALDLEQGRLTADELVGLYCRMVFERTGSYVETARRLGLDRRTVKARVSAASSSRRRRRGSSR